MYEHELEKGKGGWEEKIEGKVQQFAELLRINSVHINSLLCRKDTTCF